MAGTEVDGRHLELSSQGKVLFGDAGVTKGDLIGHYRRVADLMLPHLRDRPLVLHRFPDGLAAGGFYQKAAPAHFPDWISRVTLDRARGGTVTHVVADEAATLVYLANLGCIELHTLLTSASEPRRAVEVILDLDPPTDDPAPVVDAARVVADVLGRLDLASRVKSTGSRGLHVHVALDGPAPVEEAKAVAGALAELVVAQDPGNLTVAHAKADRGDRLYVDWLRNGYGQHAVAPYSVRARPGAPVAVPLDWDEATSARFDPRRITVTNLARRLGQKGDPWAGPGLSYPLPQVAGRVAAAAAAG